MDLRFTGQAFTETVVFTSGALSGKPLKVQAEFTYAKKKGNKIDSKMKGVVFFARAEDVKDLKADDTFTFSGKTFKVYDALDDALGVTMVMSSPLLGDDSGEHKEQDDIVF